MAERPWMPEREPVLFDDAEDEDWNEDDYPPSPEAVLRVGTERADEILESRYARENYGTVPSAHGHFQGELPREYAFEDRGHYIIAQGHDITRPAESSFPNADNFISTGEVQRLQDPLDANELRAIRDITDRPYRQLAAIFPEAHDMDEEMEEPDPFYLCPVCHLRPIEDGQDALNRSELAVCPSCGLLYRQNDDDDPGLTFQREPGFCYCRCRCTVIEVPDSLGEFVSPRGSSSSGDRSGGENRPPRGGARFPQGDGGTIFGRDQGGMHHEPRQSGWFPAGGGAGGPPVVWEDADDSPAGSHQESIRSRESWDDSQLDVVERFCRLIQLEGTFYIDDDPIREFGLVRSIIHNYETSRNHYRNGMRLSSMRHVEVVLHMLIYGLRGNLGADAYRDLEVYAAAVNHARVMLEEEQVFDFTAEDVMDINIEELAYQLGIRTSLHGYRMLDEETIALNFPWAEPDILDGWL